MCLTAPPRRIQGLLPGLLAVAVLAGTGMARDVAPLTRLQEIWDLQGKPGSAPVPVSLDLRSLYSDPTWGVAWLHDGHWPVYVDTRNLQTPLPAGTHALVEAMTLPGIPEIDWRTARVSVRPDSGLPPATPLRPGAPSVVLDRPAWVTVTGIIRSSETLGTHLGSELVVGGEIGELYVYEANNGLMLQPLSTVQVTGVFLRADRFSKAGMRFKGFALSSAQVTVVRPDLSDYFAGPFIDPARLSSVATPAPVAIRGRVVELGPSNRVEVLVGDRAVDVQALLLPSPTIGDEIEVVGTLASGTGRRPSVEAALHRQVAPVGSRTNTEFAAVTGSLGAVRAMSRTNLDRGMPVSLTAVVTGNFTPFGEPTLFLQDDTAGIYAYPHTNIFNVQAGDIVKVDGFTSSGLFAPEILIDRITPLGEHRSPRGSSIEIGRLKSGLLDSQWQEVSGLVTRVWRDGPTARLELSDGLEKVEVRLGTTNPPVQFLDTLVRVQGVVATHYNERRQAYGAYIWCPSESYVIAQEPSGANGFQSEPEPIARLRSFQDWTRGPRRAHIRGVVTANGVAGRLVVQSDDDAIEVYGPPSTVAPPGTEVDVLGLVRWEGNRVVLRKALVRPGQTVPLPAAIPTPVATNSRPELDGLRTLVAGELLSVRRDGPALDLLMMESVPVRIRLPMPADVLPPSGLMPGARIRVTGSRLGQFDSEGGLAGYELLAATSNDLVVTDRAPWWTPRHTVSTLLATGLVALGAYGWMRSLRVKVRQQAAEIETRFRLQTDLEHRNAELVEQAGEIILRLDAGGLIEDANPAAERFFGRAAGELVGSALASQAEPEDRPRLVEALAKARAEGGGGRLEFRCRSGGHGLRWLEIQLQSIIAPGAETSLGGVARDISDRKRAEETLRQSEQNLRRIIEFLPDGVVLLDSRGIIRFQNTRACMLLGHAPGGLVGLALESLRCPALDAWVDELLESSDRSPEGLRGGAMRTLDLGRPDGTALPADVSAGAVAHGESRSCLVCFRSAASRLAAEETLRTQAAMAKAEAEVARAISLAREEDALLEECAAVIVRHIGAAAVRIWTLDAADGVPRLRASAADGRVGVDARLLGAPAGGHLDRLLANHEPLVLDRLSEEPAFAAAGAFGIVAVSIQPLVAGHQLAGLLEVFDRRPVTVQWAGQFGSVATSVSGGLIRVGAIAQLDRNNSKMRAILNSAPVAIVELSAHGSIADFNPAAEELFGWKRDAVLGVDFESLAGIPREAAAVLDRVRAGGTATGGVETTMSRAGGTPFPCSVFAAAMSGPGATRAGSVCVVVDLTERRRIEEESDRIQRKLRDAQRLESLGVMAGGIAHDFNNILTSILGNANLAGLSAGEGSELAGYVSEIEAGARRAGELCRLMLAYAGQAGIERRPADLSELVRETLRLLRHGISKLAEIRLDLAANLPAVRVDAAQIRQVVMNLAANASDALGDRPGQICIRTAVASGQESTPPHAELPPGRHILIEVADNGAGMDEAVVGRIFDPFFTTKFSGRGLGLAAVWGVVRGHGGVIAVHSRPGEGSTFRVWLPAPESVDEPLPAAAPAAVEPLRLPMRLAILIDDEAPLRAVASRILGRLGTESLEAEDGIAGIELVLRNRARKPVVLLDLTMPRMGGRDVLARLRRDAPEIPVLLMSGYAADGLPDSGTGPAADAFLSKPFTAADLHAALVEAWEKRGKAAPTA